MNPIRLTLLFGAVALLAACATTPEQKAARAQAQKRYEQDLQVNLAAQCDQETAALIRRKFDEEGKPGVATAEQKAFRLKYIDKVSDPMFQACYKMAWQTIFPKNSCAKPATIAITTSGDIRLAVILGGGKVLTNLRAVRKHIFIGFRRPKVY